MLKKLAIANFAVLSIAGFLCMARTALNSGDDMMVGAVPFIIFNVVAVAVIFGVGKLKCLFNDGCSVQSQQSAAPAAAEPTSNPEASASKSTHTARRRASKTTRS